jgi:hypothetical protein
VVLANAREVLARLERYELDVFADEPGDDDALEKAATRAGRRNAAAQASLFDLANLKVVEEIRTASDSMTSDEAQELLLKLRQQLL